MKLVTFAAAALIAATTSAYAAEGGTGGAVSGNVPQTTTQNGPYGGNPNAKTVKTNQIAEAKAMGKDKLKRDVPTASDNNEMGNSPNTPDSGH